MTKRPNRPMVSVPAPLELQQEMRAQAAKDGHMHAGRGCVAAYLKALHHIRVKEVSK